MPRKASESSVEAGGFLGSRGNSLDNTGKCLPCSRQFCLVQKGGRKHKKPGIHIINWKRVLDLWPLMYGPIKVNQGLVFSPERPEPIFCERGCAGAGCAEEGGQNVKADQG